MTTIHTAKTTCCLCGEESELRMIGSTNALGSPDLDTRPPEMQRSTMFAWVNRCAHCGYCSSDITRASGKTKAVVESEAYRSQLEDKAFPDLANSFLCKAMIAEREGRFSEAAWATIHAAWACDDAGYEESAGKCRAKAVGLMKKGREKGERFAEQDGVDIAIMTDLLRRSGRFEEALALIEENLDGITEDIVKKILMFQKKLISQSDTRCHTISECLGK